MKQYMSGREVCRRSGKNAVRNERYLSWHRASEHSANMIAEVPRTPAFVGNGIDSCSMPMVSTNVNFIFIFVHATRGPPTGEQLYHACSAPRRASGANKILLTVSGTIGAALTL